MAVELHMVKRMGRLQPASREDGETFALVPTEKPVRVVVTVPSARSIQQHRLFFALLSIASEHMGWTIEQTLVWVKLATGHVDVLRTRNIPPNNSTMDWIVPRSISFAKMTQPEFQRFFDAAMTAILDRLLPEGTPRSSLIEEVNERAGLPRNGEQA